MRYATRLQINATVYSSEVDEAVATVKKINDTFGLEPLAAYDYVGTGVNLYFAGKDGDRIVKVFVEILPKVIHEAFDRDSYRNHRQSRNGQSRGGPSWRSSWVTFRAGTKAETMKMLTAMGAPQKVKKGMRSARVKTWETFMDSSAIEDGGTFKVTTERGQVSNVMTDWDIEIDGVEVHVRFSPQRLQHGQGLEYEFHMTFDLWDRVQKALESFRGAGFDLFRGKIEG